MFNRKPERLVPFSELVREPLTARFVLNGVPQGDLPAEVLQALAGATLPIRQVLSDDMFGSEGGVNIQGADVADVLQQLANRKIVRMFGKCALPESTVRFKTIDGTIVPLEN